MSKKVVLLTLQTFSAMGGIQKMSRTLGHSLSRICEKRNWKFKMLSLYDSDYDVMPKYVAADNFRGFQRNRFGFILNVLFGVSKHDIVILTHINFAMVGLLLKFFKPGCQVWLVAHGIEVWRPLSYQRKRSLKKFDKIVCVSRYTKEQMMQRHHVPKEKCTILNNAIDSFIPVPDELIKPYNLLKRYGLKRTDPVIFTLTRLASSEKYKGYDNLILVIAKLRGLFPDIRYVLSGKYDALEGQRVKQLIAQNDLNEHVILTGYIDERELTDHFLLADLFVLPSKKEGFGIVFIEALACGLPVVCGNADGSVDAVMDGKLGTAVDPDDINELEKCISSYLHKPLTIDQRRRLQKKCIEHFSEDAYADNLEVLLAG